MLARSTFFVLLLALSAILVVGCTPAAGRASNSSFVVTPGSYALQDDGVSTLPSHVRVRAMVGERDRIAVVVEDDDLAFRSFAAQIDHGEAVALLAELDGVLSSQPPPVRSSSAPEMRVLYATMLYTRDEHGAFVLPAGVSFRALPRLFSMDYDGSTSVDERPTILVDDDANSFLPVIAVFDPSLAHEFRADLATAIADARH